MQGSNQLMKIPKTLKIGGQKYKVIYPYKFTERIDLAGQCDADLNAIKISGIDPGGNNRPLCTVWPVLFEEILHALDMQSGHKIFDSIEGHKALNGLKEGIYQVLIDNFDINFEDESNPA